MATVRPLREPAQRSLSDAIATYLAVGLAGREHDGTCRVYGGVLRRLAARFGDDSPVADLDADAVAAWFISEWGERSPATWNVSFDVIRAAGLYWREQGWTSPDPSNDPSARLRRRRTAPDRSRALSRAEVGRLLTNERYPLCWDMHAWPADFRLIDGLVAAVLHVRGYQRPCDRACCALSLADVLVASLLPYEHP